MAGAALQAFCALKVRIDTALTEIEKHSENHFDVLLDQATWGHVAILTDIEKTLADLADRLACRAEYVTRTSQAGGS